MTAAGGANNPHGTVLVVEDELLIRLDLADQLRSAGLIVIEASTGDEALTVLKANDAIDLVVSDIRMPGATDGVELAAWLRRERPKIKIVLVSGYTATQDMTTVADVALGKPVDRSLFVREVERLLGGADDGDR
jgi:CheY-like chemotaxis protein